jgi:GAF domain-containing protein
LTTVAHLAVQSLPQAMFAGVTMMVDDRVSTQAFTDATCPEIDQVQYQTGYGPCLEAFRQGALIAAESLEGDDRWPEFAAAAVARGVRSTLSLPLLAGQGSVGALNFYAGVDRAFGEADVGTARLFAAQAAVVLLNAQAYWGARLKTEHMQVALEGRQVIDMAKGIIMNTMGCGPDEAFDVLVKQSQQENRKVRDIAAEITGQAQRRRRS